jgi:hypothetical protein
MSVRNVSALLSHVGRSELLPRWRSEEVDDDLLADIDLDNFRILGLTDLQARAAVAFKAVGFRTQPPPSAAPGDNYGRVTRLLDHVHRPELLSGEIPFSFILHFFTLFLQLFGLRRSMTMSYRMLTTTISLLSASQPTKCNWPKLSDLMATCHLMPRHLQAKLPCPTLYLLRLLCLQ